MDEKSTDISNNGFKLISKYRAVIMGLAAISIYIFHAWIPLLRNPSNPAASFWGSAETFIRRTGYCGVDIFLLLSGIGLTYAIKKESIGKFYCRRIRRVYLPFLIAGLIAWPACGWSFTDFLGNVSGYNFYAVNVNCFCWFVPAIITFYIFFPLYHKAFDKVKNKLLFTAFAILIWLLVTVLLTGRMRIDLYSITNRIPVFLIGILFGRIAQDKEYIVFKAWHYLLLLLIYIAGLFLSYLYIFESFELIVPEGKLFLPNFLIAVSFPFLASKLMDIISRVLPRFGKGLASVIGFWGMISLEIYCIYSCFLVPFYGKIVLALFGSGMPKGVINLMVFALTTVLAWILYMACKYFLKLIELVGKRRESAES